MTTVDTRARADARQRAVRTFLQGMLLVALAAAGGVVATQLGDVHMTTAWWSAFGALLVKAVVQAVVAYVHARVLPPTRLPS